MPNGTERVRHIELTPEAQQIVVDAAKQWEARLAAYAYAEHLASTEADELVTADDVREALRKVGLVRLPGLPEIDPRRATHMHRDSWMHRFLAVGIAIVFLGLVGLLLGLILPDNQGLDLSDIGRVVAILSPWGLVFICIGMAVIIRRRKQLRSEIAAVEEDSMEIVHASILMRKWSSLEAAIRAIVSSHDPSIGPNALLGTVLNAYENRARLSSDEKVELRQLLDLRNNFVHSREHVEAARVAKALDDLDRHIALAQRLRA